MELPYSHILYIVGIILYRSIYVDITNLNKYYSHIGVNTLMQLNSLSFHDIG